MGKVKVTEIGLLQRIVELLEQNSAKPAMKVAAPRQINDRFTDNGDGTIYDKEQKLTWVKDPSKIPGLDKALTFDAAKSACETLAYAGFNGGWRMPTLKEEQSIRDYTKYDPAWNKEVFGGKYDNSYWTSTECAWNKDAAWCVTSLNGNVSYGSKSSHSYVRPVRSSQ